MPQCPSQKFFDISKNVSYVNKDFDSEMKNVDNNEKEMPFLIEKDELRYKEKYNIPYQNNNINNLSQTKKEEKQKQNYFKIEKKQKGRNLFV